MSANGREWKWLERDPRSSYKQLSIKGRRIKARTIWRATWGEDAMTPEQLAEEMGLPLDAVLEAVEYVESDPPEMQEDWEADERLYQETIARDPEFYLTPDKARRKLETRDRPA